MRAGGGSGWGRHGVAQRQQWPARRHQHRACRQKAVARRESATINDGAKGGRRRSGGQRQCDKLFCKCHLRHCEGGEGWRREGIGHGYEFFKFIMPHYTFVGSATYIRQLTNKYIMSMFIDSKYLPRFFSIEKYILIIFLGTKEYKITETQTRMIMLQKPNAMSIHARPAISTPNGCAWG
jgi:hypothetical protein